MNFVELLINNVNKEFYPEPDTIPEPSVLMKNIVKLCISETAKEILRKCFYSPRNEGFVDKCQDLINQCEE